MPEKDKWLSAFVIDPERTDQFITLMRTVFYVCFLVYAGQQQDAGSPLEESERASLIAKAKNDLAAAFDRYIEAGKPKK